MFGMSRGGCAVFLAAERTAILLRGWLIGRNIAVADSLVSLCGTAARSFRHGARRNGLAHIPSVLP